MIIQQKDIEILNLDIHLKTLFISSLYLIVLFVQQFPVQIVVPQAGPQPELEPSLSLNWNLGSPEFIHEFMNHMNSYEMII